VFTKLSVTVCSMAMLTGMVASAAPAEAASTPSKITSVRSTPGPGAGQITISWKQDGQHTSAFKIRTGLTSFSSGHSGRHPGVFTVPGSRRSVTLSAAQVAAAGAGVGSGNHLYFRVSAVNGSTTRAYPYLQAVLPQAAAPKASGTDIRVGSFNVRTARATSDKRTWLRRAPDVAREIKLKNPGVLAMQELGPGRADGKVGSLNGAIRQTTSLTRALRSVGAGQYKLVRETAYVKPGTTHGTQGARILYDSSRYSVLSNCHETTGSLNYNSSCGFDLPRLSGDSKSNTRSAAYAQLRDRRTGKHFWVVSVHLDDRHSGSTSKEKSYNALRGRQMAYAYGKVQAASHGEQVIIAGDINSWQNNAVGNAPHDFLVSKGFYDTAAAQTRVNIQYPTVNHFQTSLKPAGQGYGVRIDVVMVKGATGAKRFENVTKRVDSARPSDHNLVVTDIVL
jgi:endonuclease/exonuclease/phosphatase family metal-dependent hydrolase